MIEEILKKLKQNGVDRLIYCDNDILSLVANIYCGVSAVLIDDVRSATFYAFGQSKMLGRPVALLVNEMYIANCYTALTEVWFQRIPLIVITYNANVYQTTEYLERCVDNLFFLEENDAIKDIMKSLNGLRGTCLIKVREIISPEKREDYTELIEAIKNSGIDSKIICYNSRSINKSIEIVQPEHKYGILSKYMGYLCGGQRAVLCIPDYVLKYDSNSWSIRNLPNNLLVFVKRTRQREIDRFKSWIQSNGVAVYEKGYAPDLKDLSNPTIVIY